MVFCKGRISPNTLQSALEAPKNPSLVDFLCFHPFLSVLYTLAAVEVVAVEVARSRSSRLEIVELVIVIGSNPEASRARSSSLEN